MFRGCCVLLLLTFWAAGARAGAPAPEPLCLDAAQRAERAYGLPPGLLRAIGFVESGRLIGNGKVVPWPWTLDVAGVGAFFPSRASALASLETVLASGLTSVDVGCFQVNLAQHPHAFLSFTQALDPTANAEVATHFLLALHRASGSWNDAVARYHSANLLRGAAYRTSVLAAWTRSPINRAVSLAPDPHVIHVAFSEPWQQNRVGSQQLPQVIGPDEEETHRLGW